MTSLCRWISLTLVLSTLAVACGKGGEPSRAPSATISTTSMSATLSSTSLEPPVVTPGPTPQDVTGTPRKLLGRSPARPFTQRYVSDLAISPAYATDGVVFATVWNGGLFQSHDGGASWRAVNTTYERCRRPMALALSPQYANDGAILFSGGTFGPHGEGMRVGACEVISLDGGQSWKTVFAGSAAVAMAFSPSFDVDRTLFVATSGSALQREVIDDRAWSSDADDFYGVDAEQLSCGTFFVMDVAVSPTYGDDRTVFLANNAYGLCRSADGGDSWTKLTADITVYAVAVSPSYPEDPTVIAATEDGLLVSDDRGASWMTATEPPTGWGSEIAFSPNFAADGTVFASSAWGVFKSTDGGSSWQARNDGLDHLYVEALAVSPDYENDGTLFAGTHTGIYRSTDGGSSWKLASRDIDMGSVINVAASPRPGYSGPSVVIDSAGYAHIAGGGDKLSYQNNVGGAFGDPVFIPVPGTEGYARDVSIALDGSDTVHIAFLVTPEDGPETVHPEGSAYYTSNRGGSFSTPVLAAPSGWQDEAAVSNPYVAADADGHAHVAFEARGAQVGERYVAGRNVYCTSAKGGAFAEPTLVPAADGSGNIPRYLRGLEVDGTGRVHIISWQAGENQEGQIDYAAGVDGAFEPSALVASGADLDAISLAVDVNGHAHIVYRGPGEALYYTDNMGGNFAEPKEMAGSAGGHSPVVGLDEAGGVHIVFMNPRATGLHNEVMVWSDRGLASNSVRITDIGYGAAIGGQRWMAMRDDAMHIVFNNARVGGGPAPTMVAAQSPGAPTRYVLSGGNRAGPEVYHMSAPITTLPNTAP